MREKLNSLLYTAEELADKRCASYPNCDNCPADNQRIDCMDWLKADCLLSLGVTVQEWISVKDRLPEAGTKALCYLKRGEYWTAVWDDCGDDLWSDGEAWCSNGEVTHWMPLPQPPKGE